MLVKTMNGQTVCSFNITNKHNLLIETKNINQLMRWEVDEFQQNSNRFDA